MLLRVVEPYADAAKCLCSCISAAQGKLNEATPLCKGAIAIFKKVHGDEHPSVATLLNNLAGLLKDQGQDDDAACLGKQALAIFEKVLGADHPNTQTVRSSWG